MAKTKIERPYIVYSLPNNKIDQRFKNNKLSLAWEDIEKVITNVTDADLFQPDEIKLIVSSFKNINESGKNLKYYNSDIINNDEYLNLVENSKCCISKDEKILESEMLISAKNYFEKIQRKIKSEADISLRIYYSFKLIHPLEKKVLENQQLISSLTFYFSNNIKCTPSIMFPFESDSIEFWNYYDKIKSFFPIELDEKNLRLSRIKDGEITSFKKISRSKN